MTLLHATSMECCEGRVEQHSHEARAMIGAHLFSPRAASCDLCGMMKHSKLVHKAAKVRAAVPVALDCGRLGGAAGLVGCN